MNHLPPRQQMLHFALRGFSLQVYHRVARPTCIPHRNIFSSLGFPFSNSNQNQEYHERKIFP